MSDYANPSALVSPEWARQHLDDPDVRFVEVDVDTEAYRQGHLPGAVAWDWTTQLSDGIRRDIVSRDDLSELLSASGIGPDTHIVLYGDNHDWFAAWAYWQLRLHGVKRVSLLDGGRKHWLEQGFPTTTDVPAYAPTSIALPEADFALRAFQRDVLAGLGDAGLALVDVRSPAEYAGEVIAPPGMSETAQRAGHIPGAVSAPWAQTVNEDGTFKSADDLRAHFAAKGVTGDKDVITYCRIGERASHTWFVLHELLGYPRVRNYDGSWTEWGSVIGVPIENPSAVARREATAQPAAVTT
jgi:thiosulfate/3-mercaptopyruvate sulfurtransferase